MGNSDGLLQKRCRVGFMAPEDSGVVIFAFAPGFQPPILHLAKLIWHLCKTTMTRSVLGEDLPAIPGYAGAVSGRSPGTEASTPVREPSRRRGLAGLRLNTEAPRTNKRQLLC